MALRLRHFAVGGAGVHCARFVITYDASPSAAGTAFGLVPPRSSKVPLWRETMPPQLAMLLACACRTNRGHGVITFSDSRGDDNVQTNAGPAVGHAHGDTSAGASRRARGIRIGCNAI